MPRTLCVFIYLFVLILNILNLKATERISETQIQLLTASTDQNEKIWPTTSEHRMPMQMNNLLIYPTPVAFKYIILPFLSPANIIQIYDYFKNSHPELDLNKWLESFDKNNILYLKESKTLYRFSTLNHILYSSKNKIARIVKNFDLNIPPENDCAVLPSGKIVAFQPQILLGSDQTSMVAENSDENEFFITDECFGTIAYGKVSEIEFGNYKNYIFEAHDLKGLKKCFLKIRYCATIPYFKYLKSISPCLKFWSILNLKINFWIAKSFEGYDDMICCFLPCVILQVYGASGFWLAINYIFLGIKYNIIMIVFHILTLSISLSFKLNFLSFYGLTSALFFVYSSIFPKIIDDFLIHLHFGEELDRMGEDLDKKLSLTICEIQPQNNMKFLPFLIPRKNYYLYYGLILVFELLFSLIFKVFVENWV